jgi:hypothetical protein
MAASAIFPGAALRLAEVLALRVKETRPKIWGMEGRIVQLEEFAADTRERLSRIETRLEQTATKADLQEAIASMIKWVAAIAVMLGATAITVMAFVLNNAIPKTAGMPPPIVISVPAQSPAR